MAAPNPEMTYDIIVVGAGPAGCALASALAKTKSRPSILLLEAGADNGDVNLRMAGSTFTQFLNPDQNYGYKSAPLPSIGGRTIGLDRGKGLGGSSSVNFTVWTPGARDDWDNYARITGDDAWSWKQVQERYKKLESFYSGTSFVPAGMEQYVDVRNADHGQQGPLRIGYPSWEYNMPTMLKVWEANGYQLNKDLADGNPLGFGVAPTTVFRGVRSTGADLLLDAPDNLHVRTHATVHRIIFDGDKAVGIALVDGKFLGARKEIIICAGSLDTPKILLHSGIGPQEQLAKFGIPILYNNPAVGQNYRDHYHVHLKYARKPATNKLAAFLRDKTRQAQALKEWQLFHSGELAGLGVGMLAGFFKSDKIYASPEFAALPASEQERIKLPTIPTYEILTTDVAPENYMAPETTPALLSLFIFVHNSQGRGEMVLQSDNPEDPLVYRPAFLEHPYDRRVIVEATKEVLRVTRSDAFRLDELTEDPGFDVPASDGEDDILAYWTNKCASTWHMTGTCKIGRNQEDDEAVVDTRFKVFGTQNLRIADMSVVPELPSGHTQAIAYQVGMLVAEKLIHDHALDQ